MLLDLIHGDSAVVLKKLKSNCTHSIVTDPPYGINFMSKSWDEVLPPIEIWVECIRVLKPGGYLVAMSSSRTYHRLAVQLEDLGLICHPMIGHIFGSGFPKATDLSKQFDKQAGKEREVVGIKQFERSPCRKDGSVGGNAPNAVGGKQENKTDLKMQITAPTTALAKKWSGYKYGLQSLKPALEPIAVFQKPWKSKDVKRMTDNIIKHGVGAFNIDACRVESNDPIPCQVTSKEGGYGKYSNADYKGKREYQTQGRHPANLVLSDGWKHYEVKDNVTVKQLKELEIWLNENS